MAEIPIWNKLINEFKDPEDGFCNKNSSEGIVSNSEVLVNVDIRGECRFARVQL